MIKKLFYVAVVLVGLLSVSKEAEAGTLMCHGCSDAQMEQEAWNRMGQIQMYGPLYVVDLDRGVVHKYIYQNNMTPEFDPENDAFEAWIESSPVEPQVSSSILGMAQDIAAVKAVGGSVLQVPNSPEYPSNVYDAMLNSSREQALINYIREENKWGTILQEWLEKFDVPFFNESYTWYPQHIKYEDGSTATYVYNKELQRWERAPDTSVDAAGNVVPEEAADITGEYEFENPGDPDVANAMNDFEDYVRLHGMNVVDASTYQLKPPGGHYVVTCADTTCTIWYIY